MNAETTDDRPTVDELYGTAVNAKTLVVAPHRGGPADVLAAAAWSESRIGVQLLRLRSEYDGGQRARAGLSAKTDVMLLRQRLRSLAGAQEQLTIRATQWALDAPDTKARAVLLWWLDRACPRCEGRKWRTVKGTPHLSGQVCPTHGGCGGTGEAPIPHGRDGRRLVAFVEDCLDRARQSIKHRLHGSPR